MMIYAASPQQPEIMNSVQRRDLNKIRSLVDSYIDTVNPSRCNTFAGDIYKMLGCMPKRLFVACIDEILQRAFNANPDIVPSYVKLLEQIKHVSIRVESGQYFPISQAISGYCMKHPEADSSEDVAKFRRKLPLINELYKLNLLQRGYFKFFAKMFANLRRGEIGIAFLYEILNDVNYLIENGSYYTECDDPSKATTTIDEADADFWAECTLVLTEACRKGMVTNPTLVTNISRLVESIKKKTKFTDVSYSRGEMLISPIDDPAIVKISSKGPSPTSFSVKSVKVNQTPLPNGAEQDQQSMVSTAAIIQPLLPPPQQQVSHEPLSEIRLAMQSLGRHPEQFSAHAAHIQHLLEGYCASSKDAFVGAVDELLNEALNSDPRTFASYMLLLDHLIKTLPPVPLRKAVVQSAMQIHRLETVDHVVEFCSSFRLSNELCRLGLLQSHVFKHYVNELAKPERDLSYLFTYEVMRNVDRLVDSGVAQLSGLEVAFWESCGERLAKAASNRRLVSADKEKEILQFLAYVEQKGGWNRKSVRFGQKVELPLPVSRTPPELPVPVPAASQPVQPVSVPASVKPISPVTIAAPAPANMMEDAEFRSLIGLISQINAASLESTARLFKPKLQTVSTHFFTEAVEIILAKIFLQIEDEQSLEDAAKLCIAFYRQDYGCGKNFTLELQKACLKYLSSKCQTETLERARARLQAETAAKQQIVIPQEIGQLEALFRRKNIGCIRLIAKLFELKHLNFTFLLSLADSLLARKSEDALECLDALFKRIGREFEAQVLAKAMIEWWGNFCEELADIAQSSTSTLTMQSLASGILQAKKNDWSPVVEPKPQTSTQRLQSLLTELTCDLLSKNEAEYQCAVDRVRAFATTEIGHSSASFVDVFLAKIQECHAENNRFSQQVSKLELEKSQQQNKQTSSPPAVLYASGVAVQNNKSPPVQVAVKLPDAAPKPRKPTRWDQPPPLVPTQTQIIGPNSKLSASSQQVPPPPPPPSPANLHQLIMALGEQQNKVSAKNLNSFQQSQGGVQISNAFDALSAAALSMPGLQSPNALAAVMHKMCWPGMQVINNNGSSKSTTTGTGFNNNNQQFQQKMPFFQPMTTGHWQQQKQTLRGDQSQMPPPPPPGLQIFGGKNFAGTCTNVFPKKTKTPPFGGTKPAGKGDSPVLTNLRQPGSMLVPNAPFIMKNGDRSPLSYSIGSCEKVNNLSPNVTDNVAEAFGKLSFSYRSSNKNQGSESEIRRLSSSGSSTVSIDSPKGADLSLLSEVMLIGTTAGTIVEPSAPVSNVENDENKEPTPSNIC